MKMGPNRAKKGLGQPTHTDRPGPFSTRFDLPFDLVPPRAIKGLDAKSHKEFYSSSTATRPRTRSRLDLKGALMAFIYFGGFYTMTSATMCYIMGYGSCMS
jgi:hypothetical protein